MLKALDVGASYQPSRRSESWIKVKKCAPACREMNGCPAGPLASAPIRALG